MSPEAAALIRLCDALLRQGTAQDGNWGWLPFKDEVREIRDSLGAPATQAPEKPNDSND